MIAIHEAAAHNTANLPRRVAKRPPSCERSRPMNERGAREPKLRFLLPEEAVEVQSCLDLLRQHADEGVVNRLVSIVVRHLSRLTSRKIQGRLARRESDDDLAQEVAMRLWNKLARKRPEQIPPTAYALEGLVYLEIRCTLIDLCRHHLGPQGSEANRESRHGVRAADGGSDVDFMGQVPDEASGPSTCAEHTECHQLVEKLPQPEREVFLLRYYEGYSSAEAAVILGVNERTVRRQFLAAEKQLDQLRDGTKPPI